MANNVGYTPGTGALVAADNIAGVLHQRIKLGIGGDGVAVDVSEENPLPVLDVTNAESLQSMIFLLTRMLNYLNAPMGYDKSLQRQRGTVIVESGAVTVSTISTVTTVSNVANQTLMGGVQAQILVNGGNMAAWQAAVRARIT
jgi:hypothetical protein